MMEALIRIPCLWRRVGCWILWRKVARDWSEREQMLVLAAVWWHPIRRADMGAGMLYMRGWMGDVGARVLDLRAVMVANLIRLS